MQNPHSMRRLLQHWLLEYLAAFELWTTKCPFHPPSTNDGNTHNRKVVYAAITPGKCADLLAAMRQTVFTCFWRDLQLHQVSAEHTMHSKPISNFLRILRHHNFIIRITAHYNQHFWFSHLLSSIWYEMDTE